MADATTYTSKLLNKRILVIGGSSGIGFGAASASLESGAKVIIASSRQPKVDDAVSRLKAAYPSRSASVLGGFSVDLATDATLDAQVKQLLDNATNNGQDKLDHVIMTAGDKIASSAVGEITLEAAKAAGNVRFFAPLLVAKYLPSYINAGPESSLTLTTGTVAEKPIPQWSIVAGYAAGLHGMTRNLALDLKPLRVNLVSPGYVSTEMWDAFPKDRQEEMKRDVASKVPTGRVATPVELAEVYLYLMKDWNTTGQVIRSESGHTLV